jgi:glycosyltransferase involved in cell wall biosynthesis
MDAPKPRLLQMMLSTQSGGAETFFEKLCIGFSNASVPQCVVIEPNPELEKLFLAYTNIEVVPIRFGGLRELSAKKALRKAFEGFKPDVALTWMNRASRRVPAGYCPVVGRLGGYYKLKHYQNCSHLVGITPDLVDHIRANGFVTESTSLIPNFGEVATSTEEPSAARERIRNDCNINENTTVLLALGRLHTVKAHDVLIEALAKLERVELLLAGEGPLRSALQTLAQSLGVADRVHFLGWRRDVAELFAACDISVFPSRYEPNGTVVMESWAQGRPLVASKAKGPEWLVDDKVNGLLFEIDSVDGLTACLRRVMDDPAFAQELVVNGKRKFEEGFTREHIVQEYLNLFASLRT